MSIASVSSASPLHLQSPASPSPPYHHLPLASASSVAVAATPHSAAALLLAAAAANAPNASLDQDYDGAFVELNATAAVAGASSNGSDLLWNGSSTGHPPMLATATTSLAGVGGGGAVVGGSVVGARPVETAAEQLRWLFLMHTIGFGCVYSMLAFYTFFSILGLRSLISSRPYMSTINGFLCLLGASRAVCLFIDPYNLREAMPKAIRSMLWDFGFPCLTSAFCLIQLAFLQLTQSGQLVPQHRLCQLSPSTTVYIVSPWTRAKKYVLNLGPEKLRRKSCLSLVITAHFTCLITTDVAATFHDQLAVGKIVVQIVFLIWGLFLSATFLYGGYKVMQLLKHGHIPRRAGSSSGASSSGGGGCGGRLLPSESEGCGRGGGGLLSPPALASASHHGPSILLPGEDFANIAEPEARHKGIMQLALLAPLGVGVAGGASSLASSLALLPRALLATAANQQPPKIRITDEHERTFSVASSAGPASAVATPATPAKPITHLPRPHSAPHSSRHFRQSGDGHDGDGEDDEEDCSSSGSDDEAAAPLAISPGGMARGAACERRSGGVAGRRCRTVSGSSGAGLAAAAAIASASPCASPVGVRFPHHHRPPPSPSAVASSSQHQPHHRKKSLTWRETAAAAARSAGAGLGGRGNEVGGGAHWDREEESSLLPPSAPPCAGPSTVASAPPPHGDGESDYTLQALLTHISQDKCAAARKGAKSKRGSEVGDMEAGWGGGCIAGAAAVGRSRGQVSRVLRVTYLAALCCGAICLIDGGRLYAACAAEAARGGSKGGSGGGVVGPPGERPSPWPWFCLQTLSRVLELAMAIAMANVTKTPVHRYHHHNFEPEGHQQQVQHHHHPPTHHQHHQQQPHHAQSHHSTNYSLRAKQREALYM